MRAGYACSSRWMESSSWVIEGRESRHGLTASSKTEERLVRLRISDLLSRIGLRSFVSRAHPRALKGRLSSSINASSGGTRSGKCASNLSRFAGYIALAGAELVVVGRTEYWEIIHAKTVVLYTSWIFHGLLSGSNVLASNRGSGTGWKFFRPAAVMAGFFVFAKRGLILSLRICSIMDHGEEDSSSRVSVMKVSNTSVDSSKLCGVVQGSSAEVKLANEMTIFSAFPVFSGGSMRNNTARTDTANDDFSFSFLIVAVFSVFDISIHNAEWPGQSTV